MKVSEEALGEGASDDKDYVLDLEGMILAFGARLGPFAACTVGPRDLRTLDPSAPLHLGHLRATAMMNESL